MTIKGLSQLHLVGKAAIFNDEADDYEHLKEQVIQFFDRTPSKEILMNRLFRIKQKFNENVASYALDLKMLLVKT